MTTTTTETAKEVLRGYGRANEAALAWFKAALHFSEFPHSFAGGSARLCNGKTANFDPRQAAVNLDAIQLPFRVLVEGADPDISYTLSVHVISWIMSGKTLLPFARCVNKHQIRLYSDVICIPHLTSG